MNKAFSKNLGTCLSGFMFLCLFIACPASVIRSAQRSLAVCFHQLIPSLFPFFVVSNLILYSSLSHWGGLFVEPYVRCLGIRSKQAACALMIGWLGGFAAAASAVNSLFEQGSITRREAHILTVCGIGAAPAFVVNTVGLLLFNNLQIGLLLYSALWLSNIVCGLIVAFLLPADSALYKKSSISISSVPDADFTSAMQKSVFSILTVCGFAVFFGCVAGCLESLVSSAQFLRFFILSILEVSSGCISAASLPLHSVYGSLFCLSILSVSVILQVRALLCSKISILPLLAVRPVHLILSTCFFKLLLHFSPNTASVFSSISGPLILRSRLKPDCAFILFLICCCVLRFTSSKQWDIIIFNKPKKHGRNMR